MAQVLMDSASTRCFITEKLAEKIDLKPKEYENVTMFTFGSEIPKIMTLGVATIEIELRDGTKMPIEINITPVICNKIRRLPASINKEVLEKCTP